MSEKPGRVRRVTDFIGITQSAQSQQRRPVGSKPWWIYVVSVALLAFVITLAAGALL